MEIERSLQWLAYDSQYQQSFGQKSRSGELPLPASLWSSVFLRNSCEPLIRPSTCTFAQASIGSFRSGWWSWGDRVLVRSWNDKASGWYRALLAAKRGAVRLGEREVQIRAVPPRSQRLIDAADDAYAAKYTTKSNLKYVEGFRTVKRKARTLELLPASYD
ncbi:MAG TPA: DUF2255 family protein [Terriglobales bacterium]|nr:DUF2255 family protein [Terriglobales bacterium]